MSKINKELAQLLVDYGKKMYREGLVTGTGGNISLGFREKMPFNIAIRHAL